ncbi:nucleotidyltransferase family protein [Spirilliplanes yamanashiensis]|uniref:4-diphosphocytidyl-2C-methyl-D-erythritol synthase n=1 Tax=Spirilliplanes yamanashiensis TaxID=42233 RepID=A0A8J4DHM7_9ACTN|nr:NTP transferase domain-containing protein [Spirilliplanes yamanashiensis]MDP9819201.1 nicotine blue oxidoreductase [Spirilliplanes yamanashiensis]GIJ01976.1 4-diphosphocytidyl-2C-methyl-D-erythritol synthase [Spirilliplanes yamanashiensis]
MTVSGLVLAAGGGRRFGGPKALVAYRGGLLVERAAATLRAAGVARTVVVLGAAAAEVRARADLGGAVTVENPDWATGLASSLRAGLAALADADDVDATVVLLVDMPGVTPAAVRRVAAGATAGSLVTAGYGGRRGHPVVLGRDHWAGVAATATGDAGARDYLRAHAVTVVDCADVADDRDIDVPADA